MGTEDKKELILRQLKFRKDEYFVLPSYGNLLVRVGTFNVNGKKPPSDADFCPWLGPQQQVARAPDVVAVGLQELVDINNASQYVGEHQKLTNLWQGIIGKTLSACYLGAVYTHVRTSTLVGVSLLIFVRKELENAVSKVDQLTTGVGVAGVLGNKGAAAVRMQFW